MGSSQGYIYSYGQILYNAYGQVVFDPKVQGLYFKPNGEVLYNANGQIVYYPLTEDPTNIYDQNQGQPIGFINSYGQILYNASGQVVFDPNVQGPYFKPNGQVLYNATGQVIYNPLAENPTNIYGQYHVYGFGQNQDCGPNNTDQGCMPPPIITSSVNQGYDQGFTPLLNQSSNHGQDLSNSTEPDQEKEENLDESQSIEDNNIPKRPLCDC